MMKTEFDPRTNYEKTRSSIGFVPLEEATPETWQGIGFKSGLEVHQQLLTKEKLFCHCPAGIYQEPDDFDAEVLRHMRPTLSELGEYDGTALMEFKTRKNIMYRIKSETACTYEMDDTPPFQINREALRISINLALALKCNVVGEFHIIRKQYLDGSIPTGFQRTGIVGIEGEIPLKHKKIRVMQISLEEDSCREVSDIGHVRVYRTDRLGMPLIETVTYPDMLTPYECAEACQYISYLARASGMVRTGIGAARQDVNVSATGGTRVEIKGVAHIKWIPQLTHIEAFRQRALVTIKEELQNRISNPRGWKCTIANLSVDELKGEYEPIARAHANNYQVVAVNLPEFGGLLSHFTQPEKTFADEIDDRLRIIACLEKSSMTDSEALNPLLSSDDWNTVRTKLRAGEGDAQVIVWAHHDDIGTALETIEERCRLALDGVPNETRQSWPDGRTTFERVLPGPDRMYPDTDSAPIAIKQEVVDKERAALAVPPVERMKQLAEWRVPDHMHHYLLKRNLAPVIERAGNDNLVEPRQLGILLGQHLAHLEGQQHDRSLVTGDQIYNLCRFVRERSLPWDVAPRLLMRMAQPDTEVSVQDAYDNLNLEKHSADEIAAMIPKLREQFTKHRRSHHDHAERNWLIGQLRPMAIGNIPLRDLPKLVEQELTHA